MADSARVRGISKVDRRPLADKVTDVLREAIVSGELPPKTHMREVQLAEQLGVSRGPLREALRTLQLEGLIETYPGRGSFVTSFSVRDIEELYSLRCVLEKEAVNRVIREASERDIRELRQITEAMMDAASDGELSKVIKLDLRFHQALWRVADHRLLEETLDGLLSQIRMYLHVHTLLYEDLARGVADHELLMTAIEDRDAERAIAYMEKHLDEAAEVVASWARAQAASDR